MALPQTWVYYFPSVEKVTESHPGEPLGRRKHSLLPLSVRSSHALGQFWVRSVISSDAARLQPGPQGVTISKLGMTTSRRLPRMSSQLGSCHLSLLNGGTGFTVALQHCGRVGDRESGIPLLLLGSSRLSCESEATESQQGYKHEDCHLWFENVSWVVVLLEFRQILSEMVFGSLL